MDSASLLPVSRTGKLDTVKNIRCISDDDNSNNVNNDNFNNNNIIIIFI